MCIKMSIGRGVGVRPSEAKGICVRAFEREGGSSVEALGRSVVVIPGCN